MVFGVLVGFAFGLAKPRVPGPEVRVANEEAPA